MFFIIRLFIHRFQGNVILGCYPRPMEIIHNTKEPKVLNEQTCQITHLRVHAKQLLLTEKQLHDRYPLLH